MEIKGYAEIDITKKYRYLLGRKWHETLPQVTFIMLNPSKADENEGDHTLTRCIKFAQSWKKYGSLELVNLFAYRATHPTELRQVDDPVGPKNNYYIELATQRADLIILAWGGGANKHTRIKNRDKEVLSLISGQKPIYCLGLTKKGFPRHPRGLRNNLEPIIFPYQQI
jgi:hypothetical protein